MKTPMMTLGFVKACVVCFAIVAATLLAITALGGRSIPSSRTGRTASWSRPYAEACHDIEMVAIGRRSEERWSLTMDEMVGYGLRITRPTARSFSGIWRPICPPNRTAGTG